MFFFFLSFSLNNQTSRRSKKATVHVGREYLMCTGVCRARGCSNKFGGKTIVFVIGSHTFGDSAPKPDPEGKSH